jgi:RNA polymerase sigma-70 factor (ECF subfamily)
VVTRPACSAACISLQRQAVGETHSAPGDEPDDRVRYHRAPNQQAVRMAEDQPQPRVHGDPALAADSSLALLERAKSGDADALERLVARYLPRLRRWASGRLPIRARDLADTSDLVQETLVRTLNRIEHFEPRGEGALQGYLRQAVMNRIRDELRKAKRRPVVELGDEDVADAAVSPLERMIGTEAVARYEAVLARLKPSDREVVVARVELGLDNQQLAAALGKPSPNAARMAVERALVRLAAEMRFVGQS